MKFTIDKQDNKIYFKNEYSYGVISQLSTNEVEISLIKVERKFRRKGYAKYLIEAILNYIKHKTFCTKKIILSPLPLDDYGLNLEQLVKLYERYHFKTHHTPPRDSPNMMIKYL